MTTTAAVSHYCACCEWNVQEVCAPYCEFCRFMIEVNRIPPSYEHEEQVKYNALLIKHANLVEPTVKPSEPRSSLFVLLAIGAAAMVVMAIVHDKVVDLLDTAFSKLVR